MPHKDIEERNRYYREYYKKRYAADSEFREKRKKHSRKYRERNRDELCKKNREYASSAECRERARQRKASMRLEAPWLFHLDYAKTRCNNPNFKKYKYYGGKGIRMLLTKLEIEILYKRDHADQMERASIDRINPRGDYNFGNCRFIEQSENTRRRNNAI